MEEIKIQNAFPEEFRNYLAKPEISEHLAKISQYLGIKKLSVASTRYLVNALEIGLSEEGVKALRSFLEEPPVKRGIAAAKEFLVPLFEITIDVLPMLSANVSPMLTEALVNEESRKRLSDLAESFGVLIREIGKIAIAKV